MNGQCMRDTDSNKGLFILEIKYTAKGETDNSFVNNFEFEIRWKMSSSDVRRYIIILVASCLF